MRAVIGDHEYRNGDWVELNSGVDGRVKGRVRSFAMRSGSLFMNIGGSVNWVADADKHEGSLTHCAPEPLPERLPKGTKAGDILVCAAASDLLLGLRRGVYGYWGMWDGDDVDGYCRPDQVDWASVHEIWHRKGGEVKPTLPEKFDWDEGEALFERVLNGVA